MKQTKKNVLSLLFAGAMLFTLAPAPLALAADNTLYVASSGDDATYGKFSIPTRPGSYAFDGWFTEKEAGILVTADTVFKAAADVTLCAHWHSTGLNLRNNGFVLLKN